MMMWQFMALLVVHWVADFVCQTHWQASNKSKNNFALLRHIITYTLILWWMAILIFGFGLFAVSFRTLTAFVLVNGMLHFATDWFTSRWSSRHFGRAFQDAYRCASYAHTYGHEPSRDEMRRLDVDPNANHWHNFFVVIGFDQLIHQVTLAATLYFIIGSG